MTLLPALFSCEPELVAGSYDGPETCDPSSTPNGEAGTPGIEPEPIPFPWETGFEDGVCAYTAAQGYCYAGEPSQYRLVDAPVRSGARAIAFDLAGTPGDSDWQARCVQEGELPSAALYGAWFFIPNEPTQASNWNLFHFDGRAPGQPHGLWDVSISVEPNGTLRLFVFDFLRNTMRAAPNLPNVPIGTWFHLEVALRRSSEQTGSFELFLDGERGLSLTNLITDDTELGQWYLGNLAVALSPLPNTIYVDDVTISPLP